MKYLIVIPDGAADVAQQSLGGATPFQAAHTPALEKLARRGRVGLTNHVPEGLPPGSEVACMSLLGYDPLLFFTGRAPLEAAAQNILLGVHDWAVRCNLVTISNQTMDDFTAGHISSAEATELLVAAQQGLARDFPEIADSWQFFPGVSYRNLLIYRGADGPSEPAPLAKDLRATPPHDLVDQAVTDHFPRGSGSRLLTEIMSASAGWLEGHPVNRARIAAGQRPATHLWLWGAGRSPSLPSFKDTYGLSGTMITAVDLLRGLAALAGWKRLEVAGATGYLDTDYAAKGAAAIAEFATTDLVCVHIEAPDEASHEGNASEKVKAIEQIDALIVQPIANFLATQGDHRILVCPDHPTFLSTKTHSRGPVPFLIAGTGIAPSGQLSYDEVAAAASGQSVEPGFGLMSNFLGLS
ncbi:MAG: cofactor-independent phosphoglycerate mutase [Planctomycetota bacterium]